MGMFKVITRNNESGLFGVLDTNDFVVEFFEFADLKKYVQSGINIQGVAYNPSTRVWDMSLQKPVVPQLLVDKIYSAAKVFGDEAGYVKDFLLSYVGMLQRQGENLLKFARKTTPKALAELVDL